MLIIMNLNLISVQSWTYFPKVLSFSALGKNLRWLSSYSKCEPNNFFILRIWSEVLQRLPNVSRKLCLKISNVFERQCKHEKNIWTRMRNLSVLVLHVFSYFFFRSFKIVLCHTALRSQTSVCLAFSFCDKIQFSRQFGRVANMLCIRTLYLCCNATSRHTRHIWIARG